MIRTPMHWGAPQIEFIGVHPPLGCGRKRLCLKVAGMNIFCSNDQFTTVFPKQSKLVIQFISKITASERNKK